MGWTGFREDLSSLSHFDDTQHQKKGEETGGGREIKETKE
jgi:hypothetical protein